MSEELFCHVSCTPGLAGTTPCMIRKTEDGKVEARMGFALFGSTNMTDEQFKACDHNPFHENFRDNFVSGIGETQEEAEALMKKDLDSIYESMWI